MDTTRLRAFALPVMAISMVFVMLVPIPAFLLDLLLAASITASVIVFLTADPGAEGCRFFGFSDAATVADASFG